MVLSPFSRPFFQWWMISPSNKSHLTTKAMEFLEVSHGPKGKPLPGGKRYKIHELNHHFPVRTVLTFTRPGISHEYLSHWITMKLHEISYDIPWFSMVFCRFTRGYGGTVGSFNGQGLGSWDRQVTSAGRRTSSFECSMRCWERCWEIASPGTEVPDDRQGIPGRNVWGKPGDFLFVLVET